MITQDLQFETNLKDFHGTCVHVHWILSPSNKIQVSKFPHVCENTLWCPQQSLENIIGRKTFPLPTFSFFNLGQSSWGPVDEQTD